MKFLPAFLVASLLSLGNTALVRADDDVRFSRLLPPEEVSAIGMARLSSDQLAVLDALVRRDVARSHLVSKQPRAARFSDRLSADERRNAGLEQLGAPELAQLDIAVERLITPPVESTGFITGGSSSSALVRGVKLRRDPEIHGSLELMVGVGSHGYSEFGGAMTLTYDDPANRYSLAVSYAELHTKGGYFYRDYGSGYLWRPGGVRY